jgi:hypothetical protein
MLKIIFLIIVLIIIIMLILYDINKIYISKFMILTLFSKFTIGNFIILDENNKEILKVVNDKTKIIPIVKINNDNFFNEVYNNSELGLGESYMYSEWDSTNLVEFFQT